MAVLRCKVCGGGLEVIGMRRDRSLYECDRCDRVIVIIEEDLKF